MTYQQEAEQQERQEYFDRCVRVAVEKEVERIINTATCFDCDNPVEVLRTEDGGIAVKECEKCHGVPADIMAELAEWDAVIGKINTFTKQINGRV